MSNIVYQPSQTTHWKNLFPNKSMLLGSHNLNENEELIATISGVSVQAIKNKSGKDEKVPVVNFTNAPPFVLNITNARTIASLYGDIHENWIGKSIQLFATKVNAFGKQEMALRIRQKKPTVGEDTSGYEQQLRECTDMNALQAVFMAIPKHLKPSLTNLKNEMKKAISNA